MVRRKGNVKVSSESHPATLFSHKLIGATYIQFFYTVNKFSTVKIIYEYPLYLLESFLRLGFFTGDLGFDLPLNCGRQRTLQIFDAAASNFTSYTSYCSVLVPLEAAPRFRCVLYD